MLYSLHTEGYSMLVSKSSQVDGRTFSHAAAHKAGKKCGQCHKAKA